MAQHHVVVVVGAGILGASISRHLAARGARVTVLESAPHPASAATGSSWAWLNANAKQPRHYRDLNLRSMQLWQHDHPDLATFCGCLMLHDERSVDADPAYPSQHIPAGSQLQDLVSALDPQLASSCAHAKLYAQEGWCDPVQATAAFLAEAVNAGARVLYGQQVDSIDTHDGRATGVTTTSSGSTTTTTQHPADVVVLAAGVGTPPLCAQLGDTLPLLHKPAAIVVTSPLAPGTLQHMLVTDTVFILQRADGRFLIGETQPTAAANTDTSAANAVRILQLAAAAVPALSGVAAAELTTQVGYRPYPADGFPVVGWLPSCDNAYCAVTHSGMTLAPLIGQLVAEEVMHALPPPSQQQQPQVERSSSTSNSRAPLLKSEVAELLAPYRPGRDFEAAVAAAAATPSLSWAATLQPSLAQQQ